MLVTHDANGPEGGTDWQRVNWRQAERTVRNLRQRIFRAAQQGDNDDGLLRRPRGLLQPYALRGARTVLRGGRGSDVPPLPESLLPLGDQGFDASILTDFRQRLLDHAAQDRLLEPILRVCREQGWLKSGGKQRTDSTWVIANVRGLSRQDERGREPESDPQRTRNRGA